MQVELTRYEVAVISYVTSHEYGRLRGIGPIDYTETLRKLRNRLKSLAKKETA